MTELESARQKMADEAHEWSNQDRVYIEVNLTKAEYAALMAALAARQDGALEDALVTLRHARVFVTSREKMHPDGVKLYDELIDRLSALEQDAQE